MQMFKRILICLLLPPLTLAVMDTFRMYEEGKNLEWVLSDFSSRLQWIFPRSLLLGTFYIVATELRRWRLIRKDNYTLRPYIRFSILIGVLLALFEIFATSHLSELNSLMFGIFMGLVLGFATFYASDRHNMTTDTTHR